MTGAALAAAAKALVGTPFRLHGRDPATGLDCIGVLEAALSASGRPTHLPNSYALRTAAALDFGALAAAFGFAPAEGDVRYGDVLIVRPGPCQHHLLIAVARDAFVHAHLGLRRVVCGPLRPDWPLLAHWRLPESSQES